MHKLTINNISTVLAPEKSSLLEAMEMAGLQPEYHCRDGHCGACRCRLESGEVEESGIKMAYTEPDEILPCICRAKTDITLSGVNARFYQTV